MDQIEVAPPPESYMDDDDRIVYRWDFLVTQQEQQLEIYQNETKSRRCLQLQSS